MSGSGNTSITLQILQATFQGLQNAIQSVCTGIRELFFHGFGDPNKSFSRDFDLPDNTIAAPADWIMIASMSVPSIVYLRNLSATDEFMFAWNKSDAIGAKIAKTEKLILDRVIGNLYAKAVGNLVSINISVIALKLSD